MVFSLDLSIIIVSWNVCDLLDKCIQSIVQNSYGLSYEVIVVDNHSTDQTVSMLQEKYSWVKLIANSENMGFARANNLGFKLAKGNYIFILNPDTLINMNTLPNLFFVLNSYPKVGIVGPKLIFPNGEIQKPCARVLPTFQSFIFIDILRIYKLPFIGKSISRKFSTPYDYYSSQTVEAISGAAMLIRSEVMREVKGFGENFIHTGEDIDLCFQVQKLGWNIFYCSDSIVIHFGGKSSSQVRYQTMVNAAISRQEYFNRNFGNLQGIFYKKIVEFIETPVILVVGIFKLVLRKETLAQYKTRLRYAKEIWNWREIG